MKTSAFSRRPAATCLWTLLLALPLAPALAQTPDSAAATPPATASAAGPVQPTEITSTSVEMWSTDTETKGVFVGNVVVTGTNLRLTCDRLEIIATRIGDKTETLAKLDKFKYLLAVGKVHIVQGDREATCGRAEVFPREDRIVLTEKPMVVDHGSEATYVGDELMLYRGERRVMGRGVQITLPPVKDLGFDKNAAPPTAEAAQPKEPEPAAATATAPSTTPAPAQPPGK